MARRRRTRLMLTPIGGVVPSASCAPSLKRSDGAAIASRWRCLRNWRLRTWDTNIEEGLRWGLRLVEKDEQLFGRSRNPKAFVVVTDGQSWSGSVRNALLQARASNIPVYVVGIGTTAGGIIPQPP